MLVAMTLIAPFSTVEGLAQGPADIDAREFALVGGRTAHVRDALGLVRRRVAGARERLLIDRHARKQPFHGLETRRLLGRGADDDARGLDRLAFGLERDRNAERGPVLG